MGEVTMGDIIEAIQLINEDGKEETIYENEYFVLTGNPLPKTIRFKEPAMKVIDEYANTKSYIEDGVVTKFMGMDVVTTPKVKTWVMLDTDDSKKIEELTKYFTKCVLVTHFTRWERIKMWFKGIRW